ncbi:MAG: hypothetical protein ACKOXB_00355 [Flavobacteriales bacterium]
MKTSLLLLCILLSSLAFAQSDFPSIDSLKAHYEEQTLYLKGRHYIKGGEKFPIGLFRSRLLKELASSAEASVEVKKYKQLRVTGQVFGLLAVGGLLYGIAILNPWVLLIALVPDFCGVMFMLKSEEHMEKARWLYNLDQLLKTSK